MSTKVLFRNRTTCPGAGYKGDLLLDCGLTRRVLDAARFYNQLTKLPETRLVQKIYRISHYSNKKSWANSLKYHLMKLGFEQDWAEEKTIDIKLVHMRLTKLEEKDWLDELAAKPKLRLLKTLKSELAVAEHVTSFLSKKQRSLIPRLRMGNLPIALETGRYEGKSISERICVVCNRNETEDEWYLLFACPRYEETRKKWMEHLGINLNLNGETESYKNIFSKPYQLGNYLEKIWGERDKLIHNNHDKECQM